LAALLNGDTPQILAENHAGVHGAGLHRHIKPQAAPNNLP
jgi:hypothetical protein